METRRFICDLFIGIVWSVADRICQHWNLLNASHWLVWTKQLNIIELNRMENEKISILNELCEWIDVEINSHRMKDVSWRVTNQAEEWRMRMTIIIIWVKRRKRKIFLGPDEISFFYSTHTSFRISTKVSEPKIIPPDRFGRSNQLKFNINTIQICKLTAVQFTFQISIDSIMTHFGALFVMSFDDFIFRLKK